MEGRKLLVSLVLLICMFFAGSSSFAAYGEPWSGTAARSSSGKRILFIGHSKFYWHDMPKMLASMMNGRPITIGYVFGNSYSLEDHWRSQLAVKEIRSARPKWDYVVLIDQTGVPQERKAVFERFAKLFDNEIRRAGARTILVESYTDEVKDYEERHKVMMDWSKKLNIPVAPVGTAWNIVRTKYPNVSLYAPDGHHPSVKGTYLMSYFFYCYLLRQPPYDLSPKLDYADEKTGSTVVFPSLTECKNVQAAVLEALKTK